MLGMPEQTPMLDGHLKNKEQMACGHVAGGLLPGKKPNVKQKESELLPADSQMFLCCVCRSFENVQFGAELLVSCIL